MADPINISGSSVNIDIAKWKKLTAREIIREESRGQEIPEEILTWAQEMAAFAKIPDNITYEEVDGDVGIDALSKLGLDTEENLATRPEAQNAEEPTVTEDPDAVRDPARTEETEQNIFMNPTPGYAGLQEPNNDDEVNENEEITLADESLTTDPEEIRKRRIRRGLE